MDSMYLDNLDEFINDEGKIVTYKWLSLTLGVHTNTAKQMLYHFVQKHRDGDKDDLTVTYLVSGVVAGEAGEPDVHKMAVVPEESLATAKSRLKDVVSVHVYSVQKSRLTDLSLLYTANYDKVKEHIDVINKHSGIVCGEAELRSLADLQQLQKGSAYQPPPEPPRPESKYKPQVKKEPEEAKKKTASNNNKNGQIASMFAQQSKKMEDKTGDSVKVKEEKKSPTKPAGKAKTKGNISAFFNKGPVVKKVTEEGNKIQKAAAGDGKLEKIKQEEEEEEIKQEEEEVEEIKQEKEEEEETIKMEVESPVKKPKKKQQTKIKPNKSQQRRGKNKRKEEEEEAPKTKRKRIVQLSDSESSSEEEDEAEAADRAARSPTPPPPSPTPALDTARIESDSEEDVIPATPQASRAGEGRARKRKMVDKTFMDDDGFFVTKKEYEYVDDSGEDESAANTTTTTTTTNDSQEASQTSSTKASPKAASPKTPASPNKKTKDSPKKKATKSSKKQQQQQDSKKQSNIMNFFSKK